METALASRNFLQIPLHCCEYGSSPTWTTTDSQVVQDRVENASKGVSILPCILYKIFGIESFREQTIATGNFVFG